MPRRNDIPKRTTPKLVHPLFQNACYAYEDDDIVLTIYSKRKKTMLYESVYTVTAMALDDIMRKIKRY